MEETSLQFFCLKILCNANSLILSAFRLDRFKQHPYEQARIHIGFQHFTEIGQIFRNKYIVNNKKNTFQVETWPISCLNDSET